MVALFILSTFFTAYQIVPDSGGLGQGYVPRFTIQTNVLSLINPYRMTANVGSDIRIAPRWSVDVGLGAILTSVSFVNLQGELYTGGRIRAGIKYYTRRRERGLFHIGVEMIHSQVLNREYNRVFRQGGQYMEYMLTNRRVQSSGGVIRLGGHQYLGDKRRFFMAQTIGFGVMANYVWMDLPADAELVGRNEGFLDFRYPDGMQYRIHFIYGLHLGYVFW